MRNIVIFGMIIGLMSVFSQASDIVIRPVTALHTQQALASSTPNIISTCLVLDGADHLDLLNHFACQSSGPDLITDHDISVLNGSGDVVARAVSINDIGIISEPSVNKVTVRDVPFAPVLSP